MFTHRIKNSGLCIVILSLSLFFQGCTTYRRGFCSEPNIGYKNKKGHYIINASDVTLDVHSNNEVISRYIVSFLGILPYFVQTKERPMFGPLFIIVLRIQPHNEVVLFDPKLVKLRINHREVPLLTISGQMPREPIMLTDSERWTYYELTFDISPPHPDQSFVLILSEALNNAPDIVFHKSKWSEFVFHGRDPYIYGFLNEGSEINSYLEKRWRHAGTKQGLKI